MSYQPSMTMRLCGQAFAVAIIFLATPSIAGPSYGSRLLAHVSDDIPHELETSSRPVILVSSETTQQEPDVSMLALMSGKCSTLKIAGRVFTCRSVAFFHSPHGRANFTVVLDDPADESHVVSFSGDSGRREKDDLYELTIDRMLLNSKDRPKVYGLPVPFVELSAGICNQRGILATGTVSSISCSAIDKNGKKYELQFESDGLPITVRKVVQSPLISEKRRAKRAEQLECRSKADAAKVLPRDRTAYIIGCLTEDGQKPATDTDQ